MDNGKEPGGTAGGNGEGWKAILRKRREKISRLGRKAILKKLRLGWKVSLSEESFGSWLLTLIQYLSSKPIFLQILRRQCSLVEGNLEEKTNLLRLR